MAGPVPGGVLGHLRRLLGRPAVEDVADRALLARFAEQHDQEAFTALVRRHGGLVSGVCQRVLGDRHDAEDVFQATFLVLARKASSLRRPEALANWLYGVAVRLARKARVNAARRQARAQREASMECTDPSDDAAREEVRQLLDGELERLPEKYRAPLVLCYLEGRPRGEVAAQLRCSESTLKGQLERGREQLRRRLTQRGLTLSAGLLVAALEREAIARAPEKWIDGTARAALGFAVGETTAASAGAVALANGLSAGRAMSRWALTAGLSVLMMGAAVGVLSMASIPSVVDTRSIVDPAIPTWPAPEPRMLFKGQHPALQGGPVLLYSRSRHGNYPLATYAFHRGLRGDDASVANDVNLVFGNARRPGVLPKEPVGGVPGVANNGAVGMDAPTDVDEFRVTCLSGSQHRIIDLGTIDYASLVEAPKAIDEAANDPDADTAIVRAGHVYVIRLHDPEHEELCKPRYVKLCVAHHRDNDAVLFVWAPLKAR